MRHYISNEEKTARKLKDLISDVTLDLEMIAVHLYNISPNVIVNRILLIADIIQDEKDERHNDYL